MHKSWLVPVLSILLMAGCEKQSAEPGPHVYRMPLPDKVQTLNPRWVRALADDQILKSIFDPLIIVDEDGYLKPNVCYRWEISQDFKEYTFFIRKDVLFHDGWPLTAKDILFSFHHEGKKPTLIHKIFSPIEGYDDYYDGKSTAISGVVALDDYTVKIRLKKPIATFLYTLANGKFVILPVNFHGVGEDVFFKKPVGTGPYVFQSWNDNELKMKANPGYFGNRGHIREFVFTTMDKKKALAAFERREVDDLTAYKVLPSDIKRSDVNIFEGKAFSTQLLFFNVKKEPLSNAYLRLAIRAAVDKEKLVKECYPHDDVATGVIPKGLVGAIDNPHMFDDLNESVDFYLSKAGMNRKKLPKMILMRLTEMKDDCYKPTMDKMFRENGLSIEVEFVSFEECVRRINANDYYMLSEWLSVRNVEPINIINFFDGRSTHNLPNVNDPDINRLIDIAELTRTRSARGEIYRQISEMIIRKAYAMDIQFENRYYIYDKSVRDTGDLNPMKHFGRFDRLSFN